MPKKPKIQAGKDVESEGSSSDGEDDKAQFINPLTAKKKQQKIEGELSEGEWSDDSDQDAKKDKKKGKKDKKLLGKRGNKDRDDEDDMAKDFFGNSGFQEVPADDPGSKNKKQVNNDESLDSDEIAETRILAKKMLRKKSRQEMLDSTYNRYSFHEKAEELPSWFVKDE